MRAFRDDRGSAVAEFAVAMPAVLLVLATLLAGVQVAGVQLRAQDAAADAARSWARGDGAGVVATRLQRQLPGARVARSAHGDLVCATVSASPPGLAARLGITISAASCALGGGR
jgi:Flp pilus assembly protein TadG